MVGQAAPKRRRPWIFRPVPIIAGVTTLLLTLATVPPLLAGPTPVELDDEGQKNAQADGWQTVDLGVEAELELLGGLVSLESHALQRNDEDGYPAAGYSWATVKIPAMLPRDVVEDRLREGALETVHGILQGLSQEHDTGVELDTTPVSDTTFTENGYDTRITRYQTTALVTKELPKTIQIEGDTTLGGQAFIATWRCSILGSYALALAVARDIPDIESMLENATDVSGAEDLEDLQDLQDHYEGDPEDLLEMDEDELEQALGDDLQVTIHEIQVKQSAGDQIDQIQKRLLAHTVCAE